MGEYAALERPEDPDELDPDVPTPTRAPDSGPATGPSQPGSSPDPGDDLD